MRVYYHTGRDKYGLKKIYSAKTTTVKHKWEIQWSEIHAIASNDETKNILYFGGKTEHGKTPHGYTMWAESKGRVLSIVGPYVSFEYSVSGDGGGVHPYANTSFSTTDISTGKQVKLNDLFNDKDIFNALINDSFIKKTLNGKAPNTLAELLQQADGGCEADIQHWSLNSFAFHHIKNGKIAIRIGFSHGCEVLRGTLTQVGIYLPIPKELNVFLMQANKEKHLMDQMQKLKY